MTSDERGRKMNPTSTHAAATTAITESTTGTCGQLLFIMYNLELV